MKFFSFSKTVVLFAVFTAAYSATVPKDGVPRFYAVACIVDIY